MEYQISMTVVLLPYSLRILVRQGGIRQSHSTSLERTRTTLGDRSFAMAGPRVWNSLPATIKQITSYGQLGNI